MNDILRNLNYGKFEPEMGPDRHSFDSAFRWKAHKDYETRGGYLYESGIETRDYLPTTFKTLPTDFAKLSRGDDSAIIEFAQRWGRLGFTRIKYKPRDFRPDKLDPDIIDEYWDADPVSWIRSHAAGVDFCLHLLLFLKKNDAHRELAEYLEPLLAYNQEADQVIIRTAFGIREAERSSLTFSQRGNQDVETLAWKAVLWIINANIRALEPHLERIEGKTVSLHKFDALLEAIYAVLAGLAVDDSQIGRCENCGSLFIQFDRRQRFCPNVNTKGEPTGGESSCAIAKRMREYYINRKRREQESGQTGTR